MAVTEGLLPDTTPLAAGVDVGDAARRVLREPLVWRGILTLLAFMVVLVVPARIPLMPLLIASALAVYAVTRAANLRRSTRRWRDAVVIVASLAGASAIIVDERTWTPRVVVAIGLVVVAAGVWRVVGSVRRSRGERLWSVAVGIALVCGGLIVAVFGQQVLSFLVIAATASMVGIAGIAASHAVAERPVAATGGAVLADWLHGRTQTQRTQAVLVDRLFIEGPGGFARLARFAMLMALASGISTMGVITDSTAVVIGAMLIAPLMTPLLGTSLALFTGWPNRLTKAALTVVAGVAIALLVSMLLAAMLPGSVDPDTNSQVLSRISPTVLDLITAVIAGIAGAYATSRGDVADSLPGVAIAIALVPPLCVTGVMWEQAELTLGFGSLLLFTTNAIAIVIVGGATYVITGAAPFDPSARMNQRIRTAAASVAALAALVVLALSANGARIVLSAFDERAAEDAVEEWLAGDPAQTLIDVQVTDRENVTVDISGPDTTLSADDLADDIAEQLGHDVTVEVRRIPLESEVVTAANQ